MRQNKIQISFFLKSFSNGNIVAKQFVFFYGVFKRRGREREVPDRIPYILYHWIFKINIIKAWIIGIKEVFK